jgi:hypothetical protein
MLDGSQSSDADGDSLDYAWTQTSGPGVTLSNAGSAIAQFTAPSVDSDTMLQFRLSVTDPGGLGDTSTVTVTVTSGSAASDSGGSGGAADWFFIILLLSASAAVRGCQSIPAKKRAS